MAKFEAILRAGGDLFLKRGFDGVSLYAVAGAAGVSKATINTLTALFELADREFRYVRDETLAEIAKAEIEDNAGGEQISQAAGGLVGDH